MRIRSIAVGAAAVVLVAGCGSSGGTTGNPTTAPQPTSTSKSGGAPKVSNPLDVKAFEAAPCTMATSAQVTAFGLPGVAGRVSTSSPGAACIWLGASTPFKAAPGATILPEGTNLDSIYGNKDTTYQVFEELPAIQGYPAAMTLAADTRSKGDCEIVVGVSDEKAILFTFQSFQGSPKFADPCGAITEFAGLVVTTIKAGAK